MAAHDNVKKVNKPATSGNSFFNFFKGLVSEFKRITWASKENVKKATATVIAFCFMYVVIVGLMDFGFNSVVQLMLK